jgi:hypothetical protein
MKNEAFVTKNYVPEHKGKSVLTDKVWASKIYNARRIFITLLGLKSILRRKTTPIQRR